MDRLHLILERYFGHTAFRPYQQEIIQDLLSGRDVLAVLATGGGKSLCYQAPALIGDGVTLVISPLIALMKDQVDDLQARGIPAEALNSSCSYATTQRIFSETRGGVHPHPLRLAGEGCQQRLPGLRRIPPCDADRRR
ncbi:MAG: DEAD/DEAH box helicase [Methanoculleus sp.]